MIHWMSFSTTNSLKHIILEVRGCPLWKMFYDDSWQSEFNHKIQLFLLEMTVDNHSNIQNA